MTAPARTVKRRRSRKGEGDRLRDEIVAATERLLIEKGHYEAVSIRAIADAIGVTPPSIYLHFPDKEAMLVAVCEKRFDELDRVSEAAAAQASDPLDEVRRRGEAYLRFGLEHPEQYRVLFMDPGPKMDAASLQKSACLEHMVEAVDRAMRAGQVAGRDPFLVALQLWAAVHGLVSLLIAKPDFPWPPVEQLLDGVLDMAAYGLRGPPPAARGRRSPRRR